MPVGVGDIVAFVVTAAIFIVVAVIIVDVTIFTPMIPTARIVASSERRRQRMATARGHITTRRWQVGAQGGRGEQEVIHLSARTAAMRVGARRVVGRRVRVVVELRERRRKCG